LQAPASFQHKILLKERWRDRRKFTPPLDPLKITYNRHNRCSSPDRDDDAAVGGRRADADARRHRRALDDRLRRRSRGERRATQIDASNDEGRTTGRRFADRRRRWLNDLSISIGSRLLADHTTVGDVRSSGHLLLRQVRQEPARRVRRCRHARHAGDAAGARRRRLPATPDGRRTTTARWCCTRPPTRCPASMRRRTSCTSPPRAATQPRLASVPPARSDALRLLPRWWSSSTTTTNDYLQVEYRARLGAILSDWLVIVVDVDDQLSGGARAEGAACQSCR